MNYLKLKKIANSDTLIANKELLISYDFPPMTIQLVSESDNPENLFRFKEGICFRCNKKIPSKTYCHPMYGGQFKQHYGWYVNQEYYKLGFDRRQFSPINIIPETCSQESYDTILRIKKLINQQQLPVENVETITELYNWLDKAVENSVRKQFGIPSIGDAWVSETILYNIVNSLYAEQKILRHYRPNWLEGLELDIYLPNIKLAFEYQGIQHYRAVEHWGGKAQLKVQQEHDKRKKELCEKFGIRLICIDYDEPLNSEHIIRRIQYDS